MKNHHISFPPSPSNLWDLQLAPDFGCSPLLLSSNYYFYSAYFRKEILGDAAVDFLPFMRIEMNERTDYF